jgi:hypothetical protein
MNANTNIQAGARQPIDLTRLERGEGRRGRHATILEMRRSLTRELGALQKSIGGRYDLKSQQFTPFGATIRDFARRELGLGVVQPKAQHVFELMHLVTSLIVAASYGWVFADLVAAEDITRWVVASALFFGLTMAATLFAPRAWQAASESKLVESAATAKGSRWQAIAVSVFVTIADLALNYVLISKSLELSDMGGNDVPLVVIWLIAGLSALVTPTGSTLGWQRGKLEHASGEWRDEIRPHPQSTELMHLTQVLADSDEEIYREGIPWQILQSGQTTLEMGPYPEPSTLGPTFVNLQRQTTPTSDVEVLEPIQVRFKFPKPQDKKSGTASQP